VYLSVAYHKFKPTGELI